MDIPASFVLDLVVLSDEVFKAYVRLLYECCQIYDKQTSMEELCLVSRLVPFGYNSSRYCSVNRPDLLTIRIMGPVCFQKNRLASVSAMRD